MSKNKYVLLFVTGLSALSMIAANVTNEGWTLSIINKNTAAVGQSEITGSGGRRFPALALARAARGDEAVNSLGIEISEVASYYKVPEERLRNHLKKDRNLWVDKRGRLFYEDRETVSAAEAASAIGSPSSILGVAPLEQTFQLHSKPGSSKTLYLDFNGHRFQAGKSYWIATDFDAPAFDTDGDPSTFNENERQTIQAVWLRVSEDFAPFNVDVTTEEPSADKLERVSASDSVYGNRVLFTPASGTLQPGAGGSSYVGVFDDVGETAKIALVFPEMLGNYEKYMGEAASHEAGHSLGLFHQGVSGVTEYYYGQGDWAPTMGVGYYKNITQWSKGEYANPSNVVDEIQTIISYGPALNTDDHGNSISNATNLTITDNNLSGGGLIEKNTDTDYFKFNTGAGQVTINLNVAYGANLDAEVALYDSSGNLIVKNDAPGLPSSVSAALPAGTFYVSVKGVGSGNPLTDGYTNYGSLGRYSVSGTVTSSPNTNNPPTAQISANPTSGGTPITVAFSSAGSFDPEGGALTYSWNFGDGTTSQETNPQKTYSTPGSYTVTLSVSDSTGLSDSKSVTITSSNQAPTASFTVSKSGDIVPVTALLNASASSDPDGTITSYTWDFGDNTSGTGVSTNHTYSKAGTYAVRLTVTDNNGTTGSKTISVTAKDPVSVVVAAPRNLSASYSSRSKTVSLKWSDSSTNETNFVIERAVYGSAPVYQVIGEVSANVKTYTDKPALGTYYYRVQAVNKTADKKSPYSNADWVRAR